MDSVSCVVCARRVPAKGLVCDVDRARISGLIAGLPARMRALQLQLVPGGGPGAGGRTSSSRTGSPTGARLDALTLTGPGSDRVTASTAMLHPLVRKWHITRPIQVTIHIAGKTITTEREVTSWFSELVRDSQGRPVQLAHDDQIGILPPAQWLVLWASRWRALFGHHQQPAPRRHFREPKTRQHAGETAAAMVAAAVRRQKAADLLAGLHGHLPAPLRPDDPLADEWEIRFSDPGRDHAPVAAAEYLLTWLDTACSRPEAAVDAFAAELRSLSEELGRVLGEQPDQQWLGRCPAQLTDRNTGVRPCGSGLWQDPYASQVTCPRCRSTWGPARTMLLALAIAIRDVWPVDRRRRYTTAEISEIGASSRLTCPACGRPLNLAWRDVTEPADVCRYWQPIHATCPEGHAEAKGVI